MTRRDFELIAEAVSDARGEVLALYADETSGMAQYARADELQGVKRVAHQLAKYLGTTNPRFDRERFLKAAGVVL